MITKLFLLISVLFQLSLFAADDMNLTEIKKLYKNAVKLDTVTLKQDELLKKLDDKSKLYLIHGWPNVTPMIVKDNNATKYAITPIDIMSKTLIPFLDEHNQSYTWLSRVDLEKADSTVAKHSFSKEEFLSWFSNISTFLYMAIFAFYILHSMGLFEKKIDTYKPEDIEGSFDDIVGQEEIKRELKIVSDMVKKEDYYKTYGIDRPTNMIFSGAPGTGKTKMAGYFAKSLGFTLIYASASNLETGYVGGGSNAIKKLDKLAKKAKNAVVFLDEAQTLLMKRGQSRHKWADDTTNTLLTVLDGVSSTKEHNIIWILASNFDDTNLNLDPALMRRFQKQINFRMPIKDERIALFEFYIKQIDEKNVAEIDYDDLATIANNLSPAKIAAIVKEAAANAAENQTKVDTKLLLDAYERDVVGLTTKTKRNKEDRDSLYIATHELGHFFAHFHAALKEVLKEKKMTLSEYEKLSKEEKERILYLAREETDIIKISIQGAQKSEGGSLGYALFKPDEDDIMILPEFKDKIVDLYGGLAAESAIFGEENISLGAMDDLKRIEQLSSKLYDAGFNHVGLIEKSKKEFLKRRFQESIEAINFHKEEILTTRQKLLEEGKLTIDEIVPIGVLKSVIEEKKSVVV